MKPADDSVEASLNAKPAQISPTAKRLDGPPESFANVVSIVERSAMPEQDRLEIYLGILHQMSPTLHGFAAAAGWDSSRVAKLLTTGSGIFPPPVDLGSSGRDDGGERLRERDRADDADDPGRQQRLPSSSTTAGPDPLANRPARNPQRLEPVQPAVRPPAADQDLLLNCKTGSRSDPPPTSRKDLPSPTTSPSLQQPGLKSIGEIGKRMPGPVDSFATHASVANPFAQR